VTPRRPRTAAVLGLGILIGAVLGGFLGGVAGAGARDSVDEATVQAAREKVSTCQLRIVRLEYAIQLKDRAFQALADDDSVAALSAAADANEVLESIDADYLC
jgi:hypothetical protein